MNQAELEFLGAHVKADDEVFEWGPGASTLYLAPRVKRVVSVEHQRLHAIEMIARVPANVSILYVPPDKPFDDASGLDGDKETFESYASSITAMPRSEVVIIDGRARMACGAKVSWARERGLVTPRFWFLHDSDRPEYSLMFKSFREVRRVDRLALLGPR